MRKIILIIIFLNGCSFTEVGYFKDQKKYINDEINGKINFDKDGICDACRWAKEKNKSRILDKAKLIDASLITSDPNSLDFKIKNSYFIPNPCDPSLDNLKIYNKNPCTFPLLI